MMIFARCISVVFVVLACLSAKAQSSLSCLVDGEYLPVFEVRNKTPYCFTGDGLIKGRRDNLTLLSTEDFTDGFAQIEILKNVRAGVSREDGLLIFASSSDWYLLIAKITPDRDLNDCYFSLGFDTYGTKSYLIRDLGDLEAGKSRVIQVYVKLGYEMPEQLHLFSGMEEVRTTLMSEKYSYENGRLLLASR